MRTLVLIILVIVNIALGTAFMGVVFDRQTLLLLKLAFGTLAVALYVAAIALAAVRLSRLPAAAVVAFRLWCFALPTLFLLGSLDNGIISGQELLASAAVGAFAWLNWRAVAWFSSAPVAASS